MYLYLIFRWFRSPFQAVPPWVQHAETRLCPQAWPSTPSISCHLLCFFIFRCDMMLLRKNTCKVTQLNMQNASPATYVTRLLTDFNRIRTTSYWIVLSSFQNYLDTCRGFLRVNRHYILEDTLNYRNTHLNQSPCFKMKLHLLRSNSSTWKSLRTSQESSVVTETGDDVGEIKSSERYDARLKPRTKDQSNHCGISRGMECDPISTVETSPQQ